jgi:glycerophosphoryl diester phosphodiesterase
VELGAEGIELDVHATRDGVVVVHHDPIVGSRLRQGRAKHAIVDLTASDLQRFPLADGIAIPTLKDVLDAIGHKATVYVEIKGEQIEPLVVRCIRESSAICAVHSFDHRTVATVKKIFPAIRTGVLETVRHADPVAALKSTGAADLWQETGTIDEDMVAQIHAYDARVVAWTSNDPREWKVLRAIGVDAICTDRIGDLATFNW